MTRTGVVYKITSLIDPTNFYIASTFKDSLISKFEKLKLASYNINSLSYNCKFFKYVRDNGGWDKFEISELEKCENITRDELYSLEKYYIKLLKSPLNSNYTSQLKYYYKNRDKINDYIRNSKTICECGSPISKSKENRHNSSKKHRDFISENKSRELFYIYCDPVTYENNKENTKMN